MQQGLFSVWAVSLPGSNSYSDHYGLAAGDTYYYIVYALNAGGASGSDTVSVTTMNSCAYSLAGDSINCRDAGVSLFLSTSDTLSACTGFDFSLAFDTSHYDFSALTISPNTINPADATYSSQHNADGTITFSVYIKGTAPVGSSFNGTGALFELVFTKDLDHEQGVDTFAIENIVESYTMGTLWHCVDMGTVQVSKDSVAEGSLFAWNTRQAMSYQASNPAAGLITRVYGADVNCVNTSTSYVSPDNLGVFRHPLSHGTSIRIERDIQGSFFDSLNPTHVMPFINGADAFLTQRIAMG